MTNRSIISQIQNVCSARLWESQIYFVSSVRKKILGGLILSIYLSFIVIFLQPFDTHEFEAEYRTLLLSGYGMLTFVVLVAHSNLENLWYFRFGKVWSVACETVSAILFCLLAGTTLYLYNRLVVNDLSCTLATYWRFLSVTVAYMIPVFVPLMLFLRQKLGERILPVPASTITFTGENRDEILTLEIQQLLFVRAVENYVEICFRDQAGSVISKTFRQTLSRIERQVPGLNKCHRSYLVNMDSISGITGNSQGAKITFNQGDKAIPISKTYYSEIKSIHTRSQAKSAPDLSARQKS